MPWASPGGFSAQVSTANTEALSAHVLGMATVQGSASGLIRHVK